ncbi:hypothetical protein PTT_15934 [Pyrenophora teres f. teres 0-1]|uniref:Uncharacterized protein n=1 Tax=Pyrenophora teres f. teres (strain 0-1) TaxID=861557 RepID=E3S182_PYRTT|nr:hypothetical protein PTT_15934 [Pyrenophora teres f. teres 0-1]
MAGTLGIICINFLYMHELLGVTDLPDPGGHNPKAIPRSPRTSYARYPYYWCYLSR